jgi:cyclohexadieny/prephenate dehydrogenase
VLAEPHFRRVAFLGIGLIGSSLARVIREKGLADEIVAYSRTDGTRERAVELGVVDRAEADPADAVAGADLVVFALHLGGYAPVAEAIAGRLEPGAIVTDVGSAKAAAAAALKAHLPDTVHLVPGHPVAGTEFSGPEAGFAELFDKRFCILTPDADADPEAVGKIRALWRAAGMQVETMDAHHHDIVLALTSHLPHVIAYTIVGTATELEEDLKSEVIKFSAGGFRDFTRIAASDPEFWRDVLLTNREAVLEMLTRFTEDLTAMRKALRRHDGDALLDWFTRTREVRRGIIDARQHEWEDSKKLDG